MEILKRDFVKKNLSPINKQLNKHGGSENKIKITTMTIGQIEFLYDLLSTHLQGYMDFACEEIMDFHHEDMKRYAHIPNFRLPVEIHGITLPEQFGEDFEWELLIGRTWFGGTQMVLTMKGWEIEGQAIVG